MTTVKRENCTILLIDDEPKGLEVRGRVLQGIGYKVFSAKTGAEGLALFQAHDVDVVVTDHMAGSAFALASSLKRLKPHVYIISFSGSADPEMTRSYADVCIHKEEGPQALIGALDRIVAKTSRRIRPRRPARRAPAPPPSHALLATIVEDSIDAILSKTLDGTITSWNRAAELMYGYTREEAIGSSVTMLLPDDRKDEARKFLERLARGEHISNYETVRVAKNGSKLNVLLTISPVRDSKRHIVGASTIARDITAQKFAEHALQRAERLALIGRMAATVAHEINNPLEAVNNILYLLRSSELSPDARKFVELASGELERVMHITQLTLSMQRGPARSPVALRVTNLLDNVLTLYLSKNRKMGIHIERHYDDEGLLMGFPVELQQVFSNLIVNAMDAMVTKGDRLVLGVRRARRISTGESGVRISVLDNGPGIAPEHLHHLFQPFYTTKGEEGTGIGLWVSRNIVEKHHGTLRMHSSSRAGRSGTCFSVFLPAENVSSMPKAA